MLRRSFLLLSAAAKAPHLVLGLPANATEQQIKDRYKELARRMHPDMPGGNERKFQELSAAYNILRMRASAREDAISGRRKKARTMSSYRGEDDKGEDDEDGAPARKHRSYVDEEEEAELRAQERAAEAVRQMQSQTFIQMMWTMSTFEIFFSIGAALGTCFLVLHRNIEYKMGDRIDFNDVALEGEERLKFNEPLRKLTNDETEVMNAFREVAETRTQTSHTKLGSLREVLMVFDADRGSSRKVEARPVSADLVDEQRLIDESPILARIDGKTAVTPYHNISYSIKEKVANRQWSNVDVGPAINLLLEGARRVPKNNPAQYRMTTFEYRSDEPGSDGVPRVVVTVVNDKFPKNEGRCQRLILSGVPTLHPELILKRRLMLRDGKVQEEQLEELKLIFPVRDEGLKEPEHDPRRVMRYDPPLHIPVTKM